MNRVVLLRSGLASLWLLARMGAVGQEVPVTENLWRLEAQEDTDGDKRITVHDRTTPFVVRDKNGGAVRTVEGVYGLSVMLQELAQAEDRHQNAITMADMKLDEPAADRTSRLIREQYWDALTRRIDADHLDQVLNDSKVAAKYEYIYVPGADSAAVNYFKGLEKAVGPHRFPALKVVVLPPPEKIDAKFLRGLEGADGILSLKLEFDNQGRAIRGVPYVVPGGRFNELYCWDSYFIVLGLLQDGRKDLARSMADNLIYEAQYYGKIPNANRTYYLSRSQPPFLTSIIRAVFDAGAADRAWLAAAMRTAFGEYETVWRGPGRRVKIGSCELSRYHDDAGGPCPEVEPGHYDESLEPWIRQVKLADGSGPLTPQRFLGEYVYAGKHAELRANGITLDEFFENDRATRESGHDTTHRFGDRSMNFVTVDLNSLLYRYEMDFAEVAETEFGGRLPDFPAGAADAKYWREQADRRKEAMMKLMWDEGAGYFFDYDFVRKERSSYISATGLHPLWAGIFDAREPAEKRAARRCADYALGNLMERAGLAATAKKSVAASPQHDARQWDYPYGWAPHQMLAWRGFWKYGFGEDAGRLAYRWLYTIAKNAQDYNGMIPEKFNVVTGSHEVLVEYGNVGTKFAYIAREGFGWMNASFEVGKTCLSAKQLDDLRRLIAPKK